VTCSAIGYHGPVKAAELLAAVLAIVTGLLPVAPPEHVHEAEEHGHVHAIIHRHLKPHGILGHDAERRSTLDDDDGPALTLTTIYTVPAPVALTSPARIVSASIEPPPPPLVERPSADVGILIHGPPRAPTPPRAPPVSPTS
jgi:hypothetical protein